MIENIVDSDHQKTADLDLQCFQNRIYPGSAGQGLTVEIKIRLIDSSTSSEIQSYLDQSFILTAIANQANWKYILDNKKINQMKIF